MPIYTRTGDTGSTSLFGGKRVLKCEELVEVYGSIDELNSWVGLISAQLKVQSAKLFLDMIQSDLLTLGSTLAGWKPASQGESLQGYEEKVKEMEARMDAMEKELPPLKNFILPGGSVLGAQVHITRSICRRVERQLVSLKVHKVREVQDEREEDLGMIIKYINRLSDLFFVLARFINKEENVEEVTWSGIKSVHKE